MPNAKSVGISQNTCRADKRDGGRPSWAKLVRTGAAYCGECVAEVIR